MVKKRRLLVEGAGDRADLSAQCRKGFQRLFEKAGLGGALPRVVPCGSRSAAFEKFRSEFTQRGKDDMVMLLVDGEAPVVGDDPWEHVRQREGDNFRREALPDRTDIEAIAKREVYRALEAATRATKSGAYGKGTHSFKLLAEIDPGKLQGASPSARRLFDVLRRAAAD
jgi:hypothetical protein